jgi:hypothetical protein
MKNNYSKGSKKYVVLALLAVLLLSLGALSMQKVNEGFKEGKKDKKDKNEGKKGGKKQGTEAAITNILTQLLGNP